MLAKGLTPILNVSNIQESFAWFEKLGWRKDWDWDDPATLRRRLLGRVHHLSLPGRPGWPGQVEPRHDLRAGGRRRRGQGRLDVDLGRRRGRRAPGVPRAGTRGHLAPDRHAVERPRNARPAPRRPRLPDQPGDSGVGLAGLWKGAPWSRRSNRSAPSPSPRSGRRAPASRAPPCARRWSGSSWGPTSPTSASSSKTCSRSTPTSCAALPMRWHSSPTPSARAESGPSAPATPVRGWPSRRGRRAWPAPWWRSRRRRRRSSNGCGRSAPGWCRCPTTSSGRRSRIGPIPAWRGPSSIPSTTRISSPGTPRWDWKSWKTRPTPSR